MTSKDVLAGLVTPIVIVTTTLSYVALIFSGPLASSLPLGIGYGLISAGVMAIVFALGSGVPFAIAGPDSKPVAVLATLSVVMVADMIRRGHAAAAPATVLTGLILATIITGTTLWILGAVKAGRWIRFVPYPVIAGFMAASGWLLASGGVRIVTGLHISPELVAKLARGERLPQLALALVFAVGMYYVKRIRHALAFPGFLVCVTALTHLGLHAAGLSIPSAQRAGWLLSVASGADWPIPAVIRTFSTVDFFALLLSGGGYFALVAVTTMTLLLSLIAVEIETGIDIDLDREMRLNGVTNIISGLGGGMVGTLSVSRTLFNYRTGARARASGVLAGTVCLLVLAFGTGALGYVPVPLLAALLIQLGTDMLRDWLVKGWNTMQRAEYTQMVVIFLVTIFWDFVVGVALGIVTACVAFAVSTSRLRLLRLGLNRSVYTGSVDRPVYQQEELARYGQSIQIMWLHGFVFFGSAHRLLLQIRDILDSQPRKCRSLILDFRQVLGIDSSAVVSLVKLRQIGGREGFALAICGVPAEVESVLRAGGLLKETGDSECLLFPDTDSALEWSEEKLLAELMTRDEALRSADEWLVQELGGRDLFTRLVSYLELIEYRQGDLLLRQGDTGDSLYLLFTGRATVFLHTPRGGDVRLRSMMGHTIVGEMGLYRGQTRGASVRADEPTVAYRMSTEALARMERDDPAVAYAFHKLVIRTLASRLDFANREVAGLRS